MKRSVAINDLGLRIGEDHPNAKLTDREVDQLLLMHEQGVGYRRLAARFEISKSGVRDICKGRNRSQIAARWRTVKVG